MTHTVHVITDLGPTTDGPGLVVPAELLGPHINGVRIFYYSDDSYFTDSTTNGARQ